MDRNEITLAALAAAGENSTFTPVQVQKLFFLLDKEASHLVDGPHYDFKPYDYGPFDKAVYDTLDSLKSAGKTEVHSNGRYRIYSLSQEGFDNGGDALGKLPEPTQRYVRDLVAWVKSMSFEQLVSSIYEKYPDMKANSVFRG